MCRLAYMRVVISGAAQVSQMYYANENGEPDQLDWIQASGPVELDASPDGALPNWFWRCVNCNEEFLSWADATNHIMDLDDRKPRAY